MNDSEMKMFELHIADTDVTSGSIPVTWCVDKELLEQLRDRHIEDPQVVISVAPVSENYHGTMEYRKVVPLKDMMAYIDFHFPGKNKIYAVISGKSKKSAKEFYLARRDYGYYEDVLNTSGDDYASWIYWTAKPLEVEVPEACFGKAPSQFEKEWLAYLGKNKLTDQCSLRKRRLLYPFQAMLLMLDLLVRTLVFIVAAMVGSRSLTPQYILHPLTYSLADTLIDTFTFPKGIYFIGQTSNKFVNYSTLIFMPAVLSVIMFGVMKPVFGAALLLLASLLIIVGLIVLAVKTIKNFLEGRGEVVESEDDDTPWYMDPEEMAAIVCSGEKKPLKVADLPSKKRTLKLRFQELKSQVCKPFAG